MFYSPTGEIGFPFSDQKLTVETWFYFLFEHLIVVILALAILVDAQEYRFALKTFVVIEIIDTVDYILTYGTPWGVIKWNVIKVVLFTLTIAYERFRTSAER